MIWQAHVAEMSDLCDAERAELLDVVLAVERAQRDVLAPDKINWASFGNMVPHMHWHVIPRWRDDRHFPEPVWGKPAGADEARVKRHWLGDPANGEIAGDHRAVAADRHRGALERGGRGPRRLGQVL